MWIKIIRNGNYLTWPLITVKKLNRHFPESEETHKGHMHNQRQIVRSAKAPHIVNTPPPEEKNRDVFINVYEPKVTVCTD